MLLCLLFVFVSVSMCDLHFCWLLMNICNVSVFNVCLQSVLCIKSEWNILRRSEFIYSSWLPKQLSVLSYKLMFKDHCIWIFIFLYDAYIYWDSYSPNIKEIKVVNHRKVRRARLYYLRDKLPRFSTFKWYVDTPLFPTFIFEVVYWSMISVARLFNAVISICSVVEYIIFLPLILSFLKSKQMYCWTLIALRNLKYFFCVTNIYRRKQSCEKRKSLLSSLKWMLRLKSKATCWNNHVTNSLVLCFYLLHI